MQVNGYSNDLTQFCCFYFGGYIIQEPAVYPPKNLIERGIELKITSRCSIIYQLMSYKMHVNSFNNFLAQYIFNVSLR